MTFPRRRTAGALALLLCANIALVIVCELRCDAPARVTTPTAACHGSASTAATSESPFTVADGAHDRCEHDARPAVTIAAIKKDVSGIGRVLTGSMQIVGFAPASTSLVRIHSAAPGSDHPCTRTVLRI